MTPRHRQVLGVLAIGLVLAAGYVLKFGLYPREYDIQYDEEVQLHDGRIIVVHIKRVYRRKGLMLEKFPKYPYRMGMEFSFESGPAGKRFSHYFKKAMAWMKETLLPNWDRVPYIRMWRY